MDELSPKRLHLPAQAGSSQAATQAGERQEQLAVKHRVRRANELDGATWKRYSISIWSDIRKTPEEAALKHPAMFPVALPYRLIECLTNADQKVVLDPFAGVGSTVLAAAMLGKQGIGIEISKEYVEVARGRLASRLVGSSGSGVMHEADADDLLRVVAPGSVDLVVTSPPYWDILLQRRTADYKEVRHYGEDPRDVGRIRSYSKFIAALGKIFAWVFQALKPGGHCCFVLMDLRKKAKLYPYHMDVTHMMTRLGFELEDIIIWDRRQDYSNLRPLGYPFVFRVNKCHEYILIFAKREVAVDRRGR